MANDNHASYAKVGLVVILGIAAIIGSLIYFGGVGSKRDEVLCETYYDHPVTGLSVGSEVNFNGVKIGEVRDISFVGAEYPGCADSDAQVICIRLALDRRKCRLSEGEADGTILKQLIAKGLRATVSSSGITGLSRLELNLPRPGTEPVPARPLSWTPAYTWIPPAPSMLESFSDSATQVMDKVKKMDVAAAWSNLTVAVEAVAGTTQNLNTLVESQKSRVDEVLTSVEDASRSLKELADNLKDNPSLLLRSADPDPLPETAR